MSVRGMLQEVQFQSVEDGNRTSETQAESGPVCEEGNDECLALMLDFYLQMSKSLMTFTS